MKIINLYRFETPNVGDLNCSPCQYFDYDVERFDIKETMLTAPPPADVYIVGGGGSPRTMRYPLPGIQIAWGLGMTHRREQLKDFALIGTRDREVPGTDWVPCASCMSPLFDKEYPITQQIVAYYWGRHNFCTFEEAVQRIGSAETVCTDSYHGAYWAMLLGREVVLHSGRRTDHPKFYQIENATLDECREANVRFDGKVRDLLS
jgi:hypothetical protein